MQKKVTLKEFKEVCEAKSGNITEIARAFKVSRTAIYNWMKRSNWNKAYNDVQESMIDMAENSMHLLIKGIPELKPDPTTGKQKIVGWVEKPSERMIELKLKTMGRKRGYQEKTDVDITTGGDKIEQVFVIGGKTIKF